MRHSRERKAWGDTRCVLFDDRFARYRLRCVAGGYCSIHYHRDRANRFRVLQGELVVWEIFGPRVITHRLTDDQQLEVPSFVVHAFAAVRPTTAIEEYWPDRGGQVRLDDIVRLTIGGRAKIDQLHHVPRRYLIASVPEYT